MNSGDRGLPSFSLFLFETVRVEDRDVLVAAMGGSVVADIRKIYKWMESRAKM